MAGSRFWRHGKAAEAKAEANAPSTAEHDAALRTYYIERLKGLDENFNSVVEQRKHVKYLIEHDSLGEYMNSIQEKEIKLKLEAAEKLANPIYKREFYVAAINHINAYYQLDPSSTWDRLASPVAFRQLKRAYSGYVDALKSILEMNLTESSRKIIVKELVTAEETSKRLSIKGLWRQ